MFPGLFEAVPDALLVVDERGCIERANGQAEQLFGYPSGGLAGIDIEYLMPESVRGAHRAHFVGYISQPTIRLMGATGQTLVGQRLDGTRFPVEIALSPINGESGARYLASVRNISETQRARQVLVRARYDALLARIGQLALESDDEASVIELVPSLLADALGIEIVVIAFVHVDRETVQVSASVGLDAEALGAVSSIEATGNSLRHLLGEGRPVVVQDFSLQKSVDPRFPIAASAIGSGVMMPLLDRDRAIGALIATSSQIQRFDHDALHLLQSLANVIAALFQRRRTEDQLAHSQRLDAIGQLTGGIAHDFNNLLTVVSGSLQLLQAEYEETPEAGELIASALRSVTRGAELTNKLLAFARRQRLVPQVVDARALLRDVEQMLKRTLGDVVRLRVHCAAGLPAALADPMQLDSALVNLALNARDAMPRGGEITIDVRECLIAFDQATDDLGAGRYVLISVVDTGRGMSPETLTRAMEPFFTTKGAGRGSGLGLSMVYGFAKQSGGHLRIESALGYGTRVDLYLPVARGAVPTPAPTALPRNASNGEIVLVVEDDAAVREIAVALLHASGYRVHAVATSEEALRQLAEDPDIALLFSDVMLGNGINGKELARTARHQKPRLAVLLTSGYEESIASEPLGENNFELLRKPYRREQLAAAVQRALGA
jgi:PAS domain S-box-containing protein